MFENVFCDMSAFPIGQNVLTETAAMSREILSAIWKLFSD